MTEVDKVKVVVRMKPPMKSSCIGHCVLSTIDHIHDQNCSTWEVYNNDASHIVSAAMNGYHGTIFAYGQSGSGKTYTMSGSMTESGIIGYAISDIFDFIDQTPSHEFLIRTSFLEIYNEKLHDLLCIEEKPLKMSVSLDRQVYVSGLEEVYVCSREDVYKVLETGESKRTFGQTKQNDRSSRSHCIFRIIIESRNRAEGDTSVVMVSHLNFVDLAGSEKASENTGGRFREGCYINKSLLMLSNVISKLSEGVSNQAIGYRDSKLTRILQNELGGNSKTLIVATISTTSIEENHSTLRFATRAKKISNKPKLNETLSDTAMLKKNRIEISRLQKLVGELSAADKMNTNDELRRQLEEKEQSICLLSKQIIVSSSLDCGDSARNRRKQRRETWAAPKINRRHLSSPHIGQFQLSNDIFSKIQEESIAEIDVCDKENINWPIKEINLNGRNRYARRSDESDYSQSTLKVSFSAEPSYDKANEKQMEELFRSLKEGHAEEVSNLNLLKEAEKAKHLAEVEKLEEKIMKLQIIAAANLEHQKHMTDVNLNNDEEQFSLQGHQQYLASESDGQNEIQAYVSSDHGKCNDGIDILQAALLPVVRNTKDAFKESNLQVGKLDDDVSNLELSNIFNEASRLEIHMLMDSLQDKELGMEAMKEMFLEQGAGNGPADREADETTVVDHTLETVHAIQCHNEQSVMVEPCTGHGDSACLVPDISAGLFLVDCGTCTEDLSFYRNQDVGLILKQEGNTTPFPPHCDSSAKQASLLKRMSDVTALSEDDADHSPHISEPDTELEQLHKQNQHLLHLFKQADVDNQRYKETIVAMEYADSERLHEMADASKLQSTVKRQVVEIKRLESLNARLKEESSQCFLDNSVSFLSSSFGDPRRKSLLLKEREVELWKLKEKIVQQAHQLDDVQQEKFALQGIVDSMRNRPCTSEQHDVSGEECTEVAGEGNMLHSTFNYHGEKLAASDDEADGAEVVVTAAELMAVQQMIESRNETIEQLKARLECKDEEFDQMFEDKMLVSNDTIQEYMQKSKHQQDQIVLLAKENDLLKQDIDQLKVELDQQHVISIKSGEEDDGFQEQLILDKVGLEDSLMEKERQLQHALKSNWDLKQRLAECQSTANDQNVLPAAPVQICSAILQTEIRPQSHCVSAVSRKQVNNCSTSVAAVSGEETGSFLSNYQCETFQLATEQIDAELCLNKLNFTLHDAEKMFANGEAKTDDRIPEILRKVDQLQADNSLLQNDLYCKTAEVEKLQYDLNSGRSNEERHRHDLLDLEHRLQSAHQSNSEKNEEMKELNLEVSRLQDVLHSKIQKEEQLQKELVAAQTAHRDVKLKSDKEIRKLYSDITQIRDALGSKLEDEDKLLKEFTLTKEIYEKAMVKKEAEIEKLSKEVCGLRSARAGKLDDIGKRLKEFGAALAASQSARLVDRKKVAKLNTTIGNLEDALRAKCNQLEKLQSELATVNTNTSAKHHAVPHNMDDELRETRVTIEQLQNCIKSKDNEIGCIKTQLIHELDELRKKLRQAEEWITYKDGTISKLKSEYRRACTADVSVCNPPSSQPARRDREQPEEGRDREQSEEGRDREQSEEGRAISSHSGIIDRFTVQLLEADKYKLEKELKRTQSKLKRREYELHRVKVAFSEHTPAQHLSSTGSSLQLSTATLSSGQAIPGTDTEEVISPLECYAAQQECPASSLSTVGGLIVPAENVSGGSSVDPKLVKRSTNLFCEKISVPNTCTDTMAQMNPRIAITTLEGKALCQTTRKDCTPHSLANVSDSRDVRDSPVYLSPEFRKKAMRQKLGGMYKPVEKSFKEKSSVADDFCNTQ